MVPIVNNVIRIQDAKAAVAVDHGNVIASKCQWEFMLSSSFVDLISDFEIILGPDTAECCAMKVSLQIWLSKRMLNFEL